MSQLNGDARMDPQLIMFRKQESVLLANVKQIEEGLGAIHRSRSSANVALVEVQTAIRVREIELGITWWECGGCGKATMNQRGCEICLAQEGGLCPA